MKQYKSLEKIVYLGAILMILITTVITVSSVMFINKIVKDEIHTSNLQNLSVFDDLVLESIKEPLTLIDDYYNDLSDIEESAIFFFDYYKHFKLSDHDIDVPKDGVWHQMYDETHSKLYFFKAYETNDIILEYDIEDHKALFSNIMEMGYVIIDDEGRRIDTNNPTTFVFFHEIKDLNPGENSYVNGYYVRKSKYIDWYVLIDKNIIPISNKIQKVALVELAIWFIVAALVMAVVSFILKRTRNDFDIIKSHTDSIGRGQYVLNHEEFAFKETLILDSEIHLVAELLQERSNEINQINENLEQMVAERSRDVIEAKEQLELEIKEKEAFEAEIIEINKRLDETVLLRTEELEKVNEALKNSIQFANDANDAKGRFLAVMSHEMRTPLNGIIGFSHMLSLDIDHPKHKKTLDLILNSSKVLLTLINDVLDFSKYESGKMQFNVEEFNLKQVATEVFDTFNLLCVQKNLDFKYLNSTVMDLDVIGDPTKVKQIFYNLLNNAFKFTSQGGITVQIDVEDMSNRVKLNVEITDTGMGMTQTTINHLFEPFTQGNDLIHKSYGGTGLGLSIAKEIIEYMSGEITFESIHNAGTTCKFFIVLNRSHIKESERNEDVSKIEFKKVLYVEDNIVNQRLMEQYFNKYKVLYDTAYDGKEAVRKFSQDTYDLIFMDLQMPVMDGYEATKLIRQMDQDVKIIAMTAYTSTEVKDKCFEVGMTDFLTKPVDFKYLTDLLGLGNSSSDVYEKNLIEEQAKKLCQEINFDFDVCVELINTFIRQLNEAFIRIEGLRLSNSYEEIKSILHKMRGGSSTVRLDKINHLLIKAETFISYNQYQEAFDIIDKIKEIPIVK